MSDGVPVGDAASPGWTVSTFTDVSRVAGDAAGGATVKLTGTGISGVPPVLFGTTAATVTAVTATQVTVTVPAHAVGVVDVTLGAQVLSAAFEYIATRTVTYAHHDFEDGTLGPYAAFLGHSDGRETVTVSTDFAHAGTKSAKCHASHGPAEADVSFAHASPKNPAAGKWFYQRAYLLITQATINALSGTGQQIKFYIDRNPSGGGGPSYNWVEFGAGSPFGGGQDGKFVGLREFGNFRWGTGEGGATNSRTGVAFLANTWYEIIKGFYHDGTNGHYRQWIGTGGTLKKYTDVVDALEGNSSDLTMTEEFGLAYYGDAAGAAVDVYVDDMASADGFIDP